MKVLIVSEPGVDGVFRHVERLCYFLMERGHEVLLAYSTQRQSDRLHQLVAAIEARGFPTIDLNVNNGPAPADLPALLALWKFQKRRRADVIHGHSSKGGFLVRALRLLGMREPIFYTPNAYYLMNAPDGRKARFFHACERVLGWIGTTINVGPSEAEFARTVLGIPAERRMTIYNSVDCARFAPPAATTKRRLRAEFGIPENATVLGSLGRYSAQKDPLTMYRAVQQAHERHPDLYFFHVGQGELSGEVDAFVATHAMGGWLQRLPYLSQPDSFYKVLDGFILSSIYEGLSYATLEAVATGLPLILTRAPGNEDFGHFGLSHLFFGTPRDPASLSAAVEQWQASRHTAPNHRQVACARFDEAVCFQELLDAYRQALHG